MVGEIENNSLKSETVTKVYKKNNCSIDFSNTLRQRAPLIYHKLEFKDNQLYIYLINKTNQENGYVSKWIYIYKLMHKELIWFITTVGNNFWLNITVADYLKIWSIRELTCTTVNNLRTELVNKFTNCIDYIKHVIIQGG